MATASNRSFSRASAETFARLDRWGKDTIRHRAGRHVAQIRCGLLLTDDWPKRGLRPLCPLALLHAQKCPYCDFNSQSAGRLIRAKWVRAHLAEILPRPSRRKRKWRRPEHSWYFGLGGTPILMEPVP